MQSVFRDRRKSILSVDPFFNAQYQISQMGDAQLIASTAHMLRKEASCPFQHSPEDYLGVLHSGRIDPATREEACLTVL